MHAPAKKLKLNGEVARWEGKWWRWNWQGGEEMARKPCHLAILCQSHKTREKLNFEVPRSGESVANKNIQQLLPRTKHMRSLKTKYGIHLANICLSNTTKEILNWWGCYVRRKGEVGKNEKVVRKPCHLLSLSPISQTSPPCHLSNLCHSHTAGEGKKNCKL